MDKRLEKGAHGKRNLNHQQINKKILALTSKYIKESQNQHETAFQKVKVWASLVVQWLRICLPMQGTRVRALVWEDPTCRGATRPVSHNC